MHWTWFLTLASIAGAVLNAQRRRSCFALWMLTNAGWCAYDLTLGAHSQAALMAVYFAVAVYGWKTWKEPPCATDPQPKLAGAPEPHAGKTSSPASATSAL